MTWIKICGITNLEDALHACSLGVDALGFILAPSPRQVSPDTARGIILQLPRSIHKVGVFVDEKIEEVRRIVDYCGLNTVQLHGQETPEYCREIALSVIKAFRVRDARSLEAMEKYAFTKILLDAWSSDRAGGTGRTFPWEIARVIRPKGDYILSGGLTPGNVGEAIRRLHPMGVDVGSGVEKKTGLKELFKMTEFMQEVKKVDAAAE
jgi:phosphoribosylanthranilate isomerase